MNSNTDSFVVIITNLLIVTFQLPTYLPPMFFSQKQNFVNAVSTSKLEHTQLKEI